MKGLGNDFLGLIFFSQLNVHLYKDEQRSAQRDGESERGDQKGYVHPTDYLFLFIRETSAKTRPFLFAPSS